MALVQSEAQTPQQAAEAKVLGMFMAKEEAAPQEPINNAPAPDGDGGEPAQVEAQGTEQQGQEPAPQQSEEVEVEIEGEKYLVPKKISDRFIQHADYTRKTQDLAEMRRVASAERQSVQLQQAFEQSVGQERQQLALIDAQLAQFQNVNWGQMETQDLLRTRAQVDQLKEMRQGLTAQVDAKRNEFKQKIDTATQEALQAGQKYIAQKLGKTFEPAQQRELLEYGLAEGYTQDELSKIIDPRIVVSLWKAQQWDALQASKPGTLKRAQQAAPTVRPGATQRTPSRIQALNQAVAKATTVKGKKAAMEDYFAAKFGG